MKQDKIDNRILNDDSAMRKKAKRALHGIKEKRKGKRYTYVRLDEKTIVEREIKE